MYFKLHMSRPTGTWGLLKNDGSTMFLSVWRTGMTIRMPRNRECPIVVRRLPTDMQWLGSSCRHLWDDWKGYSGAARLHDTALVQAVWEDGVSIHRYVRWARVGSSFFLPSFFYFIFFRIQFTIFSSHSRRSSVEDRMFTTFRGDFDGMLCRYRLKCPEGLCSSSARLGKLL